MMDRTGYWRYIPGLWGGWVGASVLGALLYSGMFSALNFLSLALPQIDFPNDRYWLIGVFFPVLFGTLFAYPQQRWLGPLTGRARWWLPATAVGTLVAGVSSLIVYDRPVALYGLIDSNLTWVAGWTVGGLLQMAALPWTARTLVWVPASALGGMCLVLQVSPYSWWFIGPLTVYVLPGLLLAALLGLAYSAVTGLPLAWILTAPRRARPGEGGDEAATP